MQQGKCLPVRCRRLRGGDEPMRFSAARTHENDVSYIWPTAAEKEGSGSAELLAPVPACLYMPMPKGIAAACGSCMARIKSWASRVRIMRARSS